MDVKQIKTSQKRIYYLDFLRAVAIMLVILAHTTYAYGSPSWLAPLELGGNGVDLFFLLSGWLIGKQLYNEQYIYGNIDIKRFWIRRWFRTLPAYYAVLGATLFQLYLTKDTVSSPLPHLFFYQNYAEIDYFTISWSLALEEQFYLVIAPFLFLLSRFRKNIQILTLLFILAGPTVFRYFGVYDSLEETHVRWDCCIMGVILANFYFNYRKAWGYLVPYARFLALGCLFIYCSFYLLRYLPGFGNTADPGPLTLALIFSTFVFYAVNRPVGRMPLGHNVIMHISTRSYSMYLLHVEALAISKKLIPESNVIVFFITTLIITLLLSEILYRSIESMFLRVRDTFKFSKARHNV